MKNILLPLLMGLLNTTLFGQASQGLFYVSSFDKDYPAGIALYQLDYINKKLIKIQDFDSELNSDYLTITQNKQYLLSITMDDDTNTGLLTSFGIDEQTGSLSYIDEEFTNGIGPCYISVIDNTYAIVAHYSSGNITVISLNPDGNIFKLADDIQHSGSGPNLERQEAPHPHMSISYPKGNYVFVPDLGLDKIMVYKLIGKGKLKSAPNPYGNVSKGAGPRHFVLHPDYKFGYVVNELNSTVTAFSFSRKTGELKEIQSINSLSETFDGENYLADVHISPNGKYLYASNRGHDSISIFSIDPYTGKLSLIQTESCRGQWPRAFNIDPTGQFLIVANEHSNNMVLFQINQESGLLNYISEVDDFPAPRCIKFLN